MTLPLAEAAVRLRGRPGRKPSSRPLAGAASGAAQHADPVRAPEPVVPPLCQDQVADNVNGTNPVRDLQPRLLGTEEAARYLGMKAWSIRSLVKAGLLPVVRIPSPTGRRGRPVHKLLLDVMDLNQFIAQSKQVQPEPVDPELHQARVTRMAAARRRRAAS